MTDIASTPALAPPCADLERVIGRKQPGGGVAEQLPVDVLRGIFAYIRNHPRLFALALVCRRWLTIAREFVVNAGYANNQNLAAFPCVTVIEILPDPALIPPKLKTLITAETLARFTPLHLARLRGLASLTVHFAQTEMTSLIMHVAPTLTHLQCASVHLTREVQQTLTALRSLKISDERERSFAWLALLSQLHSLDCIDVSFLGEVRSPLTCLTHLTAPCNQIVDRLLPLLPNLRHLDVTALWPHTPHLASLSAFAQLQVNLTFEGNLEHEVARLYDYIRPLKCLLSLQLHTLPSAAKFSFASVPHLTSLQVNWICHQAFPHAELTNLKRLHVVNFQPRMPLAERRAWIHDALLKLPCLRSLHMTVEMDEVEIRNLFFFIQRISSSPRCQIEVIDVSVHSLPSAMRLVDELVTKQLWINVKASHCQCAEHLGDEVNEEEPRGKEETCWEVEEEDVVKRGRLGRRK